MGLPGYLFFCGLILVVNGEITGVDETCQGPSTITTTTTTPTTTIVTSTTTPSCRCDNQANYKQKADLYRLFGQKESIWRLVFRGTPGINKSALDSYLNKQVISVEPGCKQVFSDTPCRNHYRNNDVLDNWSDIEQVAFVVFKNNRTVGHVIFDAIGADFENWFTHERIVESSWVDLKSSTFNIFGIKGDAKFNRYFMIFKSYGGCPKDAGWFVSTEQDKGTCTWETNGRFPRFLFSTKNTATNWINGGMDAADYIAVFVKNF